jgi:hypothetical protein
VKNGGVEVNVLGTSIVVDPGQNVVLLGGDHTGQPLLDHILH